MSMSGEEVMVEAIGEVHLKMHNGIERKLRGINLKKQWSVVFYKFKNL